MPYPDQDTPDPEDPAATERYLDLIRAVHAKWDQLEAAGDSSVQLSATALSTIKESVRADARHGAHVTMPATPAGPFTVSELTLRALVRRTVDAVPGAKALRTTFEYEEAPDQVRTTGLPAQMRCRISARVGARDLPALADDVRTAIRHACDINLGLPDLSVDIHIEDLHEY